DRVYGEVDAVPLCAAGPDRLADIKKGSLVLLSFAHHHHALDRQAGELAIHGSGRGLVGGDLVTATTPKRRRDRRRLGDPDNIECERAVELALGRGLQHVRSSLPAIDPWRRLSGYTLLTYSISQFFDADHLRLRIDVAVPFDADQRLADGGL